MQQGFKRMWIYGYAILPCFTVKMLEGTEGAEMTCNNFLAFLFELIFAPFWTGKIHVTEKRAECF
jgi:hypothetical protein